MRDLVARALRILGKHKDWRGVSGVYALGCPQNGDLCDVERPDAAFLSEQSLHIRTV